MSNSRPIDSASSDTGDSPESNRSDEKPSVLKNGLHFIGGLVFAAFSTYLVFSVASQIENRVDSLGEHHHLEVIMSAIAFAVGSFMVRKRGWFGYGAITFGVLIIIGILATLDLENVAGFS